MEWYILCFKPILSYAAFLAVVLSSGAFEVDSAAFSVVVSAAFFVVLV